ncbi:hypothetical protein SESBI_22452 [Sesbania bispinosa]|nr:hypothetical protein SESBI_22452 [Sesbania bispinosa]
MPRQEVRRADDTAEYKGSSDCTQPSSGATDLNRKMLVAKRIYNNEKPLEGVTNQHHKKFHTLRLTYGFQLKLKREGIQGKGF